MHLQEVDPCEDLTDDDIRTAIQNATGPKSAVFVPDVGLFLFATFSAIFLVRFCLLICHMEIDIN